MNDEKLTAKGVTPFFPSQFRALPINSVPTSGDSSYYIIMGSKIDDEILGEGLPYFLTAGKKGLDLGTGLANIPPGAELKFQFSSGGINRGAVGDGTPDLLITQVASASANMDTFWLINGEGKKVGRELSIDQKSLTAIGNWNPKWYSASSLDFVDRGSREIRIFAADLAAFGIDVDQAKNAVALKYAPSGSSDPTFIAFNEESMNLAQKLSIKEQPTTYKSAETLGVIKVELQDGNNKVVKQEGVPVNVSIVGENGIITDGTTTVNTDSNGIATFPDLVIEGSESIKFCFTSPGLEDAVTSTIDVARKEEKLITFKYEDFSDPDQNALIQHNNDAEFEDPVLRLTTNKKNQSGSAFYKNKVSLANNRSFSTYFSFKIHGGTGADGLVFAIQTQSNSAGTEGSGMDYGGISRSLGIEFDTFENKPFDPPNAHIGIDLDGSVNSVETVEPEIGLREGVRYAWIDYDGENNNLQVYFNDTESRPAKPLINYYVDLTEKLDMDEVYVGFTAATGGSYDNHDILSWYFNNDFDPIDTNQYSYSNAPTQVELTSTLSDDGQSSTITATVKDVNGNVVPNQEVTFSTNLGTIDPSSITTNEVGVATTKVSGEGLATIKAVADGGAYATINVGLGTYTVGQSSNANLSGLTLSAGTLAFDVNELAYSTNVENSVDSISVIPTVSDNNATVTVNGNTVASETASDPINLNDGTNTITVVMTAQDGSTKEYMIHVTRLVLESESTPKIGGDTVQVDTEDVNILDEGGMLIIDLMKENELDEVRNVHLTQDQMQYLKDQNAMIRIQKEDVTLIVPTANFNRNEELILTLERLAKDPEVIPASDLSVGAVYEITLKQGDRILSLFDYDIELIFPVDDLGYKHPEELQVYYWNEDMEEWELVGGEYKEGYIHAMTSHFSTFAVFHPAEFKETTDKNVGNEKDKSDDTDGTKDGTQDKENTADEQGNTNPDQEGEKPKVGKSQGKSHNPSTDLDQTNQSND